MSVGGGHLLTMYSPLVVRTFFTLWQVLHLFNIIKIFISFTTSVLIIFYSITFGYNKLHLHFVILGIFVI